MKKLHTISTKARSILTDAIETLSKMEMTPRQQQVFAVVLTAGTASNIAVAGGTADAKNLVSSIIEVVCFIVKIIGLLWAFWGAIQFIMAQRDDDAEKKNKASMQVGTGAALVAAEWIVDKINITQYIK